MMFAWIPFCMACLLKCRCACMRVGLCVYACLGNLSFECSSIRKCLGNISKTI